MIQRMQRDRQGFTLIELVVVVAILGILAVIVTPKVMGAMDNANKNSVMSSAKQIQVGMDRMYAETGKYPDSSTLCGTGATCDKTAMVTALANYVNLNANDFDSTTAPTYTPTGTPITTYSLVIKFGNGKTATITPSSVSVN